MHGKDHVTENSAGVCKPCYDIGKYLEVPGTWETFDNQKQSSEIIIHVHLHLQSCLENLV